MENKKILIADDEERIVTLISDFLAASEYTAVKAYNGIQAVEAVKNDPEILLAVIDIMMPELDGWQATRKIREFSRIPIIMLSARSEEFDLLMGFEAGADEYVNKPFSPAVLIKRIEALLRRTGDIKQPENEAGGLIINTAAYTAFLDGRQLELTLKEYELLCHLHENAGRVLSRDQLLNAIWGYDYMGDSRTVDSHIARLRLKLGDYGASHLKTVYGMGYKLEL